MSIGRTFFDALGGSATLLLNQSPIVGDPEPVVQIAAGKYLTTGDLAVAESGEAGGLTTMAFECWLDIGTAGVSQIVALGPVADGTTRQWRLDLASGALSFSLRTAAATTVQVTAPSALQQDRWYYVVCSVTASTVALYINNVAVASTPWSTTIRAAGLTAGSADMRLGHTTTTAAMDFADVAFYRQGLSAARIDAHYTAGISRGFPQQLVSDRIKAVLDTAGSTTPEAIQTSTRSILSRYMNGQAPLNAIKEAVSAEGVDARFFTASDGTLTFLADGHRSSSPYNTVQVTFDDDGTDLPYVGLELDYSDSFLVNEVNVTAEGTSTAAAQTQTVSDATSIAAYWHQPLSLTGLPVTSDSVALTIATALLAKYKNPMTRITSITVDTSQPAVSEAVFRLELGDRIQVFRTPPGGGARINQTLFVQKISWSMSPDGPWHCTLGVSPL